MEDSLSARFGPVEVQKDNFTQIGMDVHQKDDGSVEITQKTFSDWLRPIDTSPSPLKDRNRPLGDEELQICQSKLGELRWLATVPRPDTCARLACFSAKLDSLHVVDIYRIDDLISTLKYFAGLPEPARRSLSCPDDGWGKPRPIHEGAMMLAGWSYAASGTHALDGRCRLVYIIGLMSSKLTGPAHFLHWASEFTR